jgi:hypothetical protein
VFSRGFDDCDQYPHPGCGTGSGSSSSTTTSSTGSTGGATPGCIPSESQNPVADSCGVFVSSSLGIDDAQADRGTKEKPFKSMTAALNKTNATRVFACAEGFSEPVTISAAVQLYGALDCTKSWAYDAKTKTQLTADADLVPVKVTSAVSGAEVHDFAITAIDAKSAGMSSIALLDDQAPLLLENVDLFAGTGAAGMAGAAQPKVMTPAGAKGKDGTDDMTCTVAGPIAGGAAGKNSCASIDTDGGAAGNGKAATNGGDGEGGLPTSVPSNGGIGQTKISSCKPGDVGSDGGPGSPGTGARGVGDIGASGYQGVLGILGMPGNPGQGGGGGGGARQCDMVGLFAGPSGGGGGAGGCAGLAGALGQPGGSSVGIVALSAKLVLKNVTITVKNGGVGGLGGDGQLGGVGGDPGHAPVSSTACDGGKGGQGGAGGPGGGGAGGHSVGIAMKGGMLPALATTTIQAGTGASGGAGGDMDATTQTKGDDGLACKTLDFGDAMSPKACAK